MGKIHKQFGALPIAGVALKTKIKNHLEILCLYICHGVVRGLLKNI